jgi:hypothetical protein
VACRDRNLKKEIERIVDKHGYAEQAQIKVVIVYELLNTKDNGILEF